MADPFVHLHVASGYSLRYGASSPQQLVDRAAAHGMDALALTDRDGLYGAVKFAQAGQRAGLRPIFGVDLACTVSAVGRGSRDRIHPPRRPVRGGAVVDFRHPRVTLLARDRGGWAALCRLVTATHLAGERGHPVSSAEQIGPFAERLFVLLGPDSEVGRELAAGRPDRAQVALDRWQAVTNRGNLLIEIVCHRGRGAGARAARLLRFATEHGIPAVVTNAVRYADRADAPIADVLDATRRLVPLAARHVDRVTAEAHLASGKEMSAVAEEVTRLAGYDVAAARRLCARTRSIADQCVVPLGAGGLGLGELHLPERSGGAPAGPATLLRNRCEAGFGRRGYPATPAARRRLDDELTLIAELGYPAYFLTVADIVELIKERGIRCAARGSGAGSLVTYLLGISNVDPLAHGLVMERFLSPLRHELPDIDIDVESARRTEVYEAVLARFGSERCTCVSMMDTYRARHAIRDVGAALGLLPTEIDRIATSFPHIRASQIRAALRELPELRDSGLAAQSGPGGPYAALFALAERLDGLPRHIAVHPCGVLLSDATLLDRTPVEASALGFPMSQFDKDDVEALGLVKLDVLGVRMQSTIATAVKEIRRVHGVAVDIDAVPRDDPTTFALIQSTRTLGCFQIESPGQRELIGKFGPETFSDLIIDISLFRPGPVKTDMVTPFLEARQGWRPVPVLHPDLAWILAETAGVVVFHEQVIMIVSTLTGCTLAEADEVRRALGDPNGQQEARIWFHSAALARGYQPGTVEQVWVVLEGFAAFGFCKAHAAAFAVPTYQSAWLKAHYPAAFFAGVLTHDPGMYPKRLILDDARQFGVEILPIDVNRSAAEYRVEPVGSGYGIRLGFADVRGMTEEEITRVLAGQPYHSLADFWFRAAVARPVVERLVVTGGFDELVGIGRSSPGGGRGRLTRRDLLLEVADLTAATRAIRSAGSAQLALAFDDEPTGIPSGLPELTDADRVRAELEVLGLDATRHLLTFYAPLLRALGTVAARDLLGCRNQADVLVAGVKVATQTPPVRSGRRVVFVTVDDSTGPIDATFFADAQAGYADTLFSGWLLLLRGRVRRTGARGVSVQASGCWELPAVHAAWSATGVEGVRTLLAASAGTRRVPAGAVRGTATSRSTRPAISPAPRRLWHASPGSAGR